jgi:hypothetical protein
MKKNISYLISRLILIILIQILIGCDTTEPPPVKPVKDPRTYTWTLDTLKVSFQTDLRRIWGSAPNDVYIAGHNAGRPGSLWHFDGNSWSSVELPVITYDVNGIYGFSSSDVWAVGETATEVSLILHYDGTKWKDYSTSNGKALRCIWGASPTDIWAAGTNTLFHFDGTNWKKYSFFIPPQGVHIINMSGLSSSEVYMVGGRNDVVDPIDTMFYYMYHFNGSQWSVVDSSYYTSYDYVWNFGFIVKTIGGSMYSAGYKMFKKNEDSWVIINDDPSIISLGGSSTENIFAAGLYGTAYQYNGEDWEKLTIKEGFQENIFDVWTDGTEAFMIASDGSSSFVIHGK